ncbi:MAG: Rid family detoxifying hydrolase [Aquificota bacterium]|jgi:2-iminobutanoate/2-iminopropanoate deaminase|nr:Rid family detoxifying hydrolase [Aquificaceae bacterium]MDM7267004.1 Rid family detoxifying hydrolase [Aquificaceae bacterium]QWK13691.1 MAG: Rid family detoxifying hydrolase [Aquificota bacterium]HAV39489.1 deaminase [Aquificaceae bacterium]
MHAIYTEKAPRPVGPYSQAVVAGSFLFLSGQIGLDPQTGKLREGFKEQAQQVFKNIEAILEAAGAGKESIVRMVVYLKDLSLFGEFNQLYEEFFKDVKVKPVRTTVEVSHLPLGALIEVEATAFLGEGNNL